MKLRQPVEYRIQAIAEVYQDPDLHACAEEVHELRKAYLLLRCKYTAAQAVIIVAGAMAIFLWFADFFQ